MSNGYELTYAGGEDQPDGVRRSDGNLAAMNDRVSRLASALRTKLQYLMEEFGRDPVQQLIPLVVETLEMLNSTMHDAKEHVIALQELTSDQEQLSKQYSAEKQKRIDAEKRAIAVEDELNAQIFDLKEEALTLSSDRSQFRTRCNIQRDRADKLEVKLDNLLQSYNALQEKHTKTVRQHAVLAWQSTGRALGRSFRSASVDMTRRAGSESEVRSIPGSPLKIRQSVAGDVAEEEPSELAAQEQGEGMSLPDDIKEEEEEEEETSKEEKKEEEKEEEVVVREAITLPDDVDLTIVDRNDEDMYAQEEEERQKTQPDIINEINEESLQSELGDEAFELDEAPEMAKYDQEIRKILSEKKELFDERNQLSSQRDDLLSQVEELNCEKTNLNEKLKMSHTETTSLKEEVKKLKQLLEEKREKEPIGADEKRYTRLEMAKILEQRDFYKTRCLDMEDLLKTEEMPLIGNRPKGESTGVRGFFQSLFGPKKKSPQQEARTDLIDSEIYAYLRSSDEGNTAVDTEEGCVQAYGWSLPGREFRSGVVPLDTNSTTGSRRLPLPVSPWASFSQPIPSFVDYGPLPKQETNSKVTCAIAINSCAWSNPSIEPVAVPSTDAQIWICIYANGTGHVVILNGNNPSSDDVERFSVANSSLVSGISIPASTTGKRATTTKRCATVWLGTQSGCIYVYPTIGDHSQWVNVIKLSSTPLHFLYKNNKIFVGLSTAVVHVFARAPGGSWDWDNSKKIQVGNEPDKPIGAITRVNEDDVWISVANEVYTLNWKSTKVDKAFKAHDDVDVVVSHMVFMGDGVWIAFKSSSCLRLFHTQTLEHVQNLNLSSRVQRLLGVPVPTTRPSSLKVTSLLLAHGALWAGTSTGVILSVPLTLDQKRQLHLLERAGDLRTPILASNLPCCFENDVRVFLHGHTLGVADLIVTPAVVESASPALDGGGGGGGGEDDDYIFVDTRETIVISVGEGFVDFRAKDGTLASGNAAAVAAPAVGSPLSSPPSTPGGTSLNRVHVCAWLISTKSVSI